MRAGEAADDWLMRRGPSVSCERKRAPARCICCHFLFSLPSVYFKPPHSDGSFVRCVCTSPLGFWGTDWEGVRGVGGFPPLRRACLVSSRQGELFPLKSARKLRQDTSVDHTNILELSILSWAGLEG